MHHFAMWLSQTRVSVAIGTPAWVVPTVQSIHIIAIGIVLASVFMMDLRIFGWAGDDQTLLQVTQRFAPWLWGALSALLTTGILMVIGEPVRELMSLAFWLKMSMLMIGIASTVVFQITLSRNPLARPTKTFAILTLLIWFSIVVLGRLIAYDQIWGSWSLMPVA